MTEDRRQGSEDRGQMTEDTNGEVGVRPATSSVESNTVEAI